MADNVPVTPGAGANIATDDVGGAHFQRVKPDYGGDGVSVPHIAINMDYTGGTTTDLLPAYALAFRGNGGVQYVASNTGLPIDATGTSIAILDGGANNYLSASATMNTSSGSGLFPTVTIAQFDDVSPTVITEGRFGNVRMSSRRELYNQIRDAEGNERGAYVNASNALLVAQTGELPAGTQLLGSVSAKMATDAIMNGATALTPKFAIIDAASSGDNTLVASVSGKKIRVLALVLVAKGTVDVRFESGAGGTALTGQMSCSDTSGFSLPFNPVGWFETAATTLLNLELSAAVSVDGCLVYVEV